MQYVRVKSYDYDTGKFTGCEHAYGGCRTSQDGIDRFRREYPEHSKCVIVAEFVDDEDPKWKDWFKAARASDCVHFF